MAEKPRKHPLRMLTRILSLFLFKPHQTDALVRKSYDRISSDYDETWTNHMRDLTEGLIERLDVKGGQKALDLTCGTGFATNLLAMRTKESVKGIDMSQGMIEEARKSHGATCNFVVSDALDYLKSLPTESLDLITCCWGLGYSKPFAILRQVKRVLRKGGKIGIIDNTLFSLREVLYCSFLTFMEQPDKLANLMRFRFLMGRRHLWFYYRLSGFNPMQLWSGQKQYTVDSGKAAIERLRATGAAAGFEYAADDCDSERIFKRFAEIIEEKYLKADGITITHRYLAGIARK